MSLFQTKPISRILGEAEDESGPTLHRSLNASQLVALGIGAVIGAGIFTLTGHAAANYAGPAIVLSFGVAALGCALAGLCYSEFAAMIPVAGSAYTYAYATMGEYLAWIIGWDLVLEYAVSAATVSISWSGTLANILKSFGIALPIRLASSPFETVALPDGSSVRGWVNLPAVFIVIVTSLLLMAGIRQSARVNTFIVVLKVGILIVFVGIGWQFVNPDNYEPFIPLSEGGARFGWLGVLRGAGVIFFAYIGFDAVSTAAQESKRPRHDMPIGLIGSLLICTVLFIAYSRVLTGVANYKELGVAAPVSVALGKIPYAWLSIWMQIGVLAGLSSVILVTLLGQARVFYSMARDGLLPKLFSEIHPTFRTPWRSHLVFMVFTSLFAALAPIAVVGEMTSTGTLFAFVLVCAGIIILRRTQPNIPRPFKILGYRSSRRSGSW